MTNKEISKLKWNIEQQDLFGNMACILSLAKEDMEKKKINLKYIGMLKRIIKRLMWLQNHCKIAFK